jgi:hypothetical protein
MVTTVVAIAPILAVASLTMESKIFLISERSVGKNHTIFEDELSFDQVEVLASWDFISNISYFYSSNMAALIRV